MGLLDTILSALGLKQKQEADDIQQQVRPAQSAASSAAAAVRADDDDDASGDDEDDDEGERRDYDLEEKDDFASFDFDRDIARWFTAQFRIEQAWEDLPKRDALFREYGIRNSQHWYQVKATFERWSESPAARAKYPTPGDLVQAQMTTTQTLMRDEMNLRLGTELKAELEPVEGVTLQQWAKAMAAVATGKPVEPLLAELGIDKAKWDRVSAEWNARMSRDSTASIATEYAKHFGSAGQGQFAGASGSAMNAMSTGAALSESDAPIPLEKFVEIEQAQNWGVQQGKDAAGILASFGMSPMEWGQVGGWWSMYISQNAMRNNGALHRRYTELQQKYEAKYKVGGADDDLSF